MTKTKALPSWEQAHNSIHMRLCENGDVGWGSVYDTSRQSQPKRPPITRIVVCHVLSDLNTAK